MNDYNIAYYVETAVSIFEKYTLYRESTETETTVLLYALQT